MPRGAQLPDRPTDEGLQAVCCRCIAFLIGSSAVQVSGVVRSADHYFATGCCHLMKLVARRLSNMCCTTPWASGCMAWLRDASRGLQQEEKAARAPEACSCYVLRSPSAAAIPTASAVAENVRDSTLAERCSHAVYSVVTCARAVREVSGRCMHRRQT